MAHHQRYAGVCARQWTISRPSSTVEAIGFSTRT